MTKPGGNKGVRDLHPAEQSPRASPRELAEVRRAGGVWARGSRASRGLEEPEEQMEKEGLRGQ